MNVGERIQMLRKECGLTQKSLAEETGIPIRTIINYENSGREPNAKNMAALERYFNVSGEYLRGETDQRDVMKWDDPEIMEAVQESLPEQLSRLNDILMGCSAQDQKLTFDLLVELGHALTLENQAHKTATLSLIQRAFAASTTLVDICANAARDIDNTRVTGARQKALKQYGEAIDEALIFLLH